MLISRHAISHPIPIPIVPSRVAQCRIAAPAVFESRAGAGGLEEVRETPARPRRCSRQGPQAAPVRGTAASLGGVVPCALGRRVVRQVVQRLGQTALRVNRKSNFKSTNRRTNS